MSTTFRCAAIAALVLLASPSVAAADDYTPSAALDLDALDVEADCANPPCGYIWPRLGLDADVRSPYPFSEIEAYPKEIKVEVTYSWDLEQEGTGLSDPASDMQIMVIVTRTPTWLRAELDRYTCDFTLLPIFTHYDVCTLTLTTTLLPEFFPTDEEDLRAQGHRIMIFGSSEESGTYMQSYGLEDLRFRWDDAPAGLDTDSEDIAEAPALLPLLAILSLLAAGAALRRRS